MTASYEPSRFDLSPYVSHLMERMYAPYMFDQKFKDLHAAIPTHSPIRAWSYYHLYLLARQSLHVEGDFFECGVFRGGSASFLAKLMEGSGKRLHLFDTFAGMPQTDPTRDPLHEKGDFADVSIEEVRKLVGHDDFVTFHRGRIPETFAGCEDARIAFAHIDVDIYSSVRDCCEFVYPRMAIGGVMVFDDYGHVTCIGARMAVDEYFSDKPSAPLPLYSGQAIVIKV